MARLMSVAHTEQAVVDRTKTVTRRLGWWTNKHGTRLIVPGDKLDLCRKVMGRKPGEPLIRVASVTVVDATRTRLDTITDTDVTREGFPEWDRHQFIRFFCHAMRCGPDQTVTRIEWTYNDD